jgi:hypothetical protein
VSKDRSSQPVDSRHRIYIGESFMKDRRNELPMAVALELVVLQPCPQCRSDKSVASPCAMCYYTKLMLSCDYQFWRLDICVHLCRISGLSVPWRQRGSSFPPEFARISQDSVLIYRVVLFHHLGDLVDEVEDHFKIDDLL